MAEIRLTTTVQPASHDRESTDGLRIDLTPWDLQLLLVGPIQKGLLFLKPSPSHRHSSTIIDHLKASFSRTLDFFPPLAGRLATLKNPDNTTSFSIHCNNAGAQFIYAVAPNATVADILEPVYVPRFVHSFFPLNGVQNREGVSKPLLGVQVTELGDGFFIGCSINHAVADGSSFWNFFNSWSEISRGFDKISRPPVLERWFPNDVDCPIGIPLCDKQLNGGFISFPPQFQERVFHFTKEKVAGLKAKANAEMNTSRVSSLQALMAHLWLSIIRCRRSTSRTVDADEETTFRLAIGVRPRLQPPLPQEYFGNAIYFEAVTTKAGELLKHGQGWAASEMNKVIASQKDDGIRNYFKCWVKNPRILTMTSMTSNVVLPSSSPRFNVYGNDFGWGRPVAVRSGEANKSGGKVTFFQGAEEGSIDIEVCLLSETLIFMDDDAECLSPCEAHVMKLKPLFIFTIYIWNNLKILN
ncbi:uncharacterized acetyltransferase At3g50280-like [Cornus florida]|uniref:uncharacterized acetyltransferase At3g50280-like n=1 Tax=Cornus florida TaxID=4283 RepID=UPI002897ABAC|nr:uncharacterized acetyltransferase At3g50280-like [Cornus florida]